MNWNDLIGKTIVKVIPLKKVKRDDRAWIKLEFSDETSCVIYATYKEYTGHSEDEYPVFICIKKSVEGLVPVKKN